MTEYTVTIPKSSQKSLGISLVAVNPDTPHIKIILNEVNSIGESLGLAIGDKLISINNHNIQDVSVACVLKLFTERLFTFRAAFSRLTFNWVESEFQYDTPITKDNSALYTNPFKSSCIIDDAYESESLTDHNLDLEKTISANSDQNETQKHIVNNDKNGDICFDNMSFNASNDKICLVSSKALQKGCYQWSFEIKKCDVFLTEVGVVSVSDIEGIKIDDSGVKGTSQVGARAVYGNELASRSAYYASYNDDNKQRCSKNLSNKIGWCTGDKISVCLDLNYFKVKFLLNGKRVRKCLSLQPNKQYFPFISFSGNCSFALHNETDST